MWKKADAPGSQAFPPVVGREPSPCETSAFPSVLSQRPAAPFRQPRFWRFLICRGLSKMAPAYKSDSPGVSFPIRLGGCRPEKNQKKKKKKKKKRKKKKIRAGQPHFGLGY